MVDRAVNGLGEWKEAADSTEKLVGTPLYSQMNLVPKNAVPVYLLDRSDVLGARLLTRACVDCVWPMDKLDRVMGWPVERSCCLLCRSGVVTTTLVDYPFLAPYRGKAVADDAVRQVTVWRACNACWLGRRSHTVHVM
jgi:hypothetical protein